MPETAIIDTHVHLWDPARPHYPWLAGNEILDRSYLPGDYHEAAGGNEVDGFVFVECNAVPSASLLEAEWVSGLASSEPRIKAIVAAAQLEKGGTVEADLAALAKLPLVRGVRRILQAEEPDFCLRPDFIDGVRRLADFGFSFDICVNYRQMASVLKLVEAVPDVPMILDHIGKPAIADGMMEPWASQMRALAAFPNVSCKISGVANEAGPDWKPDDLIPYLDVAFDAFGFGRTMFGGDWPVALLATRLGDWIALLDERLEGVPAADRQRFWRDNAIRVYRL
ncbi:amidohydrolase family protein [Mesorhizobium sp. CAU 1732]|uniref:amidohydrolase family protein n=1 Tax=Mesorhizobium sp. CAU 1732 TaxID=3140358 RepID=UPI00326146EE